MEPDATNNPLIPEGLLSIKVVFLLGTWLEALLYGTVRKIAQQVMEPTPFPGVYLYLLWLTAPLLVKRGALRPPAARVALLVNAAMFISLHGGSSHSCLWNRGSYGISP